MPMFRVTERCYVPEKINGMYAMLNRPSDNGHTPFGDIFVSFSKDMEFWGRHRYVMSPITGDESAWQCTKVGSWSHSNQDR